MANPPRGPQPYGGAWMIEPPEVDPAPPPRTTASNPTAVQPLSRLSNALKDFPYVGHTGPVDQFIPLYAPVRDGIAYYQDGDYGSAAISGVEAALDAAALASGIGAARLAQNAIEAGVRASLRERTYNQARHDLVKAGLIKTGDEMHHIIPRKGLGKSVQSWINHPAFLKSLPQETHQRLHRRWNGEPKFGLAEQLWHGTNVGMKAGAVGATALTSRLLPQTKIHRDEEP